MGRQKRSGTSTVFCGILFRDIGLKCLFVTLLVSSILLFRYAFAHGDVIPKDPREDKFSAIARIVEKAIAEGKTPGAVVLIGNNKGNLYFRAFGRRSLMPEVTPMTKDAIFDIASLTKVVATATAVMQLVEKRKIRLDAPAALYWPSLKKRGKSQITIRQLLTHYSGLRPDLSSYPEWQGHSAALKKIAAERPVCTPGSCYQYSDINFQILGEIVRRVSGRRLDKYCNENIFRPLGMKDTGFKPGTALHERIAPTQFREGRLMCGEVHDPVCYKMGGVAGHAGVFSTTADLALFARMMLNNGTANGVRILKPATVAMMTMPQSPRHERKLRGLGWDIEPPLATNASELIEAGAYGHLGYTGTSIWIDPLTDTFVILLTNRVHPDGRGDVRELRQSVKNAVGEANGILTNERILERRPQLKAYFEDRKTTVALPD